MRKVVVFGPNRLSDMAIVCNTFAQAGVHVDVYYDGKQPTKEKRGSSYMAVVEGVSGPITNKTCRLCTKREQCMPYAIFGYILHTDKRFANSPDHDDFFLHLGELCEGIKIEEGQEG